MPGIRTAPPKTSTIIGRYWRGLLAAGLAVSVTGLGAAGAADAAAAGRAATALLPLTVRTHDGLVKGFRTGVARVFLGIPYAAPPVGALRWRAPRPAAPWHGIRLARKPGSNCAQTGSLATGVPTTSTSENCLFLNVYTPRSSRHAGLPVMVWIHGGGFVGGAGIIYDGAVLAKKGHVIVVTINYRLNAFGFLALPSLDKERGNSSGDYGLMDQQAALRWVRSNAKAFGGNPRNVTIFGESAGGASVCTNMASPTASGLFAHAIAESGCLFPAQSKRTANQQGSSLAKSLGCAHPATAAACLRAKPVSAILKAEQNMSWGPVDGTPTLPLSPITAFLTGRYAHVPLLQGSNHDEGRFFVGLEFDALGHPITKAQYPGLIKAQFGSKEAPAILAQYPLSAYRSPDLAYSAIFTDATFSCPALGADELASGSGVYAYEFSDPNPPNDFGIKFTFPLGAAHSTELQYVFQRIPLLDTIPPFKPAQLALSNLFISYWTRFAATGNPNLRGTPHWPRFVLAHQKIQELIPSATAPELGSTFTTFHKCSFWLALEAGA
jgi:para-nitrobenzyl esterase